jgi:hypothetical protein
MTDTGAGRLANRAVSSKARSNSEGIQSTLCREDIPVFQVGYVAMPDSQ